MYNNTKYSKKDHQMCGGVSHKKGKINKGKNVDIELNVSVGVSILDVIEMFIESIKSKFKRRK